MSHDFSTGAESVSEDSTLVVAESKSFAAFDQWMDDQLAILVAQWIHTAAPNASRTALLDRRSSR